MAKKNVPVSENNVVTKMVSDTMSKDDAQTLAETLNKEAAILKLQLEAKEAAYETLVGKSRVVIDNLTTASEFAKRKQIVNLSGFLTEAIKDQSFHCSWFVDQIDSHNPKISSDALSERDADALKDNMMIFILEKTGMTINFTVEQSRSQRGKFRVKVAPDDVEKFKQAFETVANEKKTIGYITTMEFRREAEKWERTQPEEVKQKYKRYEKTGLWEEETKSDKKSHHAASIQHTEKTTRKAGKLKQEKEHHHKEDTGDKSKYPTRRPKKNK